jgi:hypothetical protein
MSNRQYVQHGGRHHPLYGLWKRMRQRCRDKNCPEYHRYGGRGITVDPRWDNFANFLADMGLRPTPRHQVERKDNDGPYSPDNCVWATRKMQSRNTRANHLVTFQGKTQTVVDWAEELGIGRFTLFKRLHRGWPVEKALTLSVGVRDWKSRPF